MSQVSSAVVLSTKAKAKQSAGTPKSKGKVSAKPTTPTMYQQILKVTAKPLSERPKLAIGRDGAKIAPRRFHLLPEEMTALKAEYKETKLVPLPFNRGAYCYFCAALRNLNGLKRGAAHPFKLVKAEMVKLMSAAETKDDDGKTAWQRFNGKEAHTENEETALKTDGRIKQNAEVLQRLGGMTPYGLKLQQIGNVIGSKGVVIDILKGKDGTPSYRLNLNSATPQNDFRKRRGA